MYSDFTNNIDEQSFTTVLFHIINEDGKYTWKPLKSSDNGPALDLGSMIAAPEFARLFVKNGYTPDNYMFSYLLFDKVNINTKNDSGETNIFPIIKNDTSEYYTINKVEATRAINSKGDSRGKIKELLICN